MQPLRIQFAAVDAPETKLDRAVEWILIAVLAFCPLAFGAVVAWSEGVFLAGVCAIAICLAIKLIRRPDARFVWSWTYLPIVLFLILIAIQLLPLPSGIVRAISSNTAGLKIRLLADLPGGADATRWMTLTFYSEATMRQLRLVAALAVLFVVVVNVFQTIESTRRLLIAISAIGLAEAMIALAQDLTHSAGIYWMIPVYDGRAISGSFVNHSHFGQFMNLSIGAALGLMLLDRHTATKREEPDQVRPLNAGVAFLPFALAITTIVTCTLALLYSLTRGGVISMLMAGAITLVILRLKAPSRSRVIASVTLLVAVIALTVAWLGFDHVYRRFASLREANAANSRGQMLLDLREAWKQFPLVGTGLGTHHVIFPMFDRSKLSAIAEHADNEYAQVMTEAGAIGLAMALTFAAMIWINYAGALRGRYSSIGAVTIGLGYGFAAVLIHSLSDFGQHIPAVAALTAVTCGLLVSLSRQRRKRAQSTTPPKEFQGNVRLRLVASIVLFAGCGLSLFAAWRVAAAEREWKIARSIEDNLRQKNWQADPQTFASRIIHAQNASDIRPGNIDYAYWLPVYRWKWISMQLDAKSDPNFNDFARRIANELNHVRLICPTFGLPASFAGQIERFVLHDPRGADDIRIGSELNRNDSTAVIVAAQLDASEGNWERSMERLKHYGDITPGGQVDAVDMYVNEFNRPDLALEVAQNYAPALERLAELLGGKQGDATIIESAKRQAGDLRMADADRKDADVGTLMIGSRIAIERGDHTTAIGYLRRALGIDYTQYGLRFELAKQLIAAGRNAEAITELRTVLRQRADFPEARELLNQLDN